MERGPQLSIADFLNFFDVYLCQSFNEKLFKKFYDMAGILFEDLSDEEKATVKHSRINLRNFDFINENLKKRYPSSECADNYARYDYFFPKPQVAVYAFVHTLKNLFYFSSLGPGPLLPIKDEDDIQDHEKLDSFECFKACAAKLAEILAGELDFGKNPKN